MIASTSPILTGNINGVPVRFFGGPTDAPDMPWHAHEDLLTALALPRGVRRALRSAILKHQADSCRTVEVEGEPILLAPHFVAQGLIGMARDIGRGVTTAPELVEREYNEAGVAAMGVLTAHLSSAEDRAHWAIKAFKNQGGDSGAA